jgi:hypothetical protein
MRIVNASRHPRLSLRIEGISDFRPIGPNLTETNIGPDVTVQVRAMVAPTAEHMIWIEGLMREHLAPTVVPKPITVEASLSELGWPVMFAHYEIYDEKGSLIEERAGAFYRLVHNHAEILVRLRNGVRWKDRAAQLKPLIMSAHVHWPFHENDLLYTLLGFEA